MGRRRLAEAIGHRVEAGLLDEAALDSYQHALTLFRAVGVRLGEANISLMLGRLARRQGNLDLARRHTQTALAVYRTMASPWNTALGLWDLANIEREAGQIEIARRYYQEALALLESIGAPAAQTVRAELEALTG